MNDIIIDTEDRFIGKHKDHRISIAKANDNFDIDVQDKTNMNIMEMLAYFKDIREAIDFTVAYIDRLTSDAWDSDKLQIK